MVKLGSGMKVAARSNQSFPGVNRSDDWYGIAYQDLEAVLTHEERRPDKPLRESMALNRVMLECQQRKAGHLSAPSLALPDWKDPPLA